MWTPPVHVEAPSERPLRRKRWVGWGGRLLGAAVLAGLAILVFLSLTALHRRQTRIAQQSVAFRHESQQQAAEAALHTEQQLADIRRQVQQARAGMFTGALVQGLPEALRAHLAVEQVNVLKIVLYPERAEFQVLSPHESGLVEHYVYLGEFRGPDKVRSEPAVLERKAFPLEESGLDRLPELLRRAVARLGYGAQARVARVIIDRQQPGVAEPVVRIYVADGTGRGARVDYLSAGEELQVRQSGQD